MARIRNRTKNDFVFLKYKKSTETERIGQVTGDGDIIEVEREKDTVRPDGHIHLAPTIDRTSPTEVEVSDEELEQIRKNAGFETLEGTDIEVIDDPN